MTRRALTIILVAAAATLTGCQKPQNILSRLLVQPDTAADLGYDIRWQTHLGLPPEARVLYAELLGEYLVTFETGNIVSVVDAATGKMLWREKLGSDYERFSRPARFEKHLVICSETRV